jgi:hypothetical protein
MELDLHSLLSICKPGGVSRKLNSIDTQICISKVKFKVFLRPTVSSSSLSWYQAAIWDPRPIFLSRHCKLSLDAYFFLIWSAIFDERVSVI